MDNFAKLTPTGTEKLKANGGKPQQEGGFEPHLHLLKVSSMKAPEGTPTQLQFPDVIKDGEVPPVAQKAPLKIAVVGTAPSSRDLAPFKDPSWTIWVCSPGNAHGVVPRVDAWFEIHSNLLWAEASAYGPPYVEWLKKQSFPIYMQDNTVVPNATRLPIEDLIREFGKYFFTSSFAYMIAMAIKAGASEIALFGVDMASKDEFIIQRPGGHYFMQKAAERGIKVSVPYESDLAQPPPLYGYDDSTPFCRKLHVRRAELVQRIGAMQNEQAKLQHSIAYLQGALEDLDYTKSIWTSLQT